MSKVISYRFKTTNKKFGNLGFSFPLECSSNANPERDLLLAYSVALNLLGYELEKITGVTLDK